MRPNWPRHGAGTTDSDSDIVLKGVVRVENLEDATEHIADVLARVKPEYLVRRFRSSPETLPDSVRVWLYFAAMVINGLALPARQHAGRRLSSPARASRLRSFSELSSFRAQRMTGLRSFYT